MLINSITVMNQFGGKFWNLARKVLWSQIVIFLPVFAFAEESTIQKLTSYSESNREKAEVTIKANKIQGSYLGGWEAIGNAEIIKYDRKIFGEYLRYDSNTQELTAEGQIKFEFDGNWVSGHKAIYNFDSYSGAIENPSYYIRLLRARGEAEKFVALNRNEYFLEDTVYTHCETGNDDWYLDIAKLKLDNAKDLGVARDAKVVFKGMPLLYSPYLDFSLSGSRKSGLLPPSIGQTAKSGSELVLPYYLNLSSNYDATISPRISSRRGIQFGNEFRYLHQNFAGDIKLDYFPNDRLFEDKRWAYSLQHRSKLGGGFSGFLSFQGVSDDQYFTDLSDNIAVTSQTNLVRELLLSYNGGWWSANARTQTFQTLQDPINPIVPPYERVPQVTVVGTRPLKFGLDLDLKGEIVNFRHASLIESRRGVFYPSVSWPIKNAFFYFNPKLGYHFTNYNFNDGRATITRSVPVLSVDSAFTFERSTSLMGESVLQSLEPRLYYVRIPYRDQDKIPNFDTAVADFNFAQIFTENQFTGSDRMNDADQITAAVTSRFISPENGNEKLRLTLAQRYYFLNQRVALASDLAQNSRTANRSDLLAGVRGMVYEGLVAEVSTQYSMDENQWERTSATFSFRKDAGKLFNVGYRFTRGSMEQFNVSVQWPIEASWNGLARWNYSTRDKRLIEGLVGIEYDKGCWTTRLVAHRFVSATEEYSTSFFAQLELTGLSRIGLNPLEVLKRNISGYEKMSQNKRTRN